MIDTYDYASTILSFVKFVKQFEGIYCIECCSRLNKNRIELIVSSITLPGLGKIRIHDTSEIRSKRKRERRRRRDRKGFYRRPKKCDTYSVIFFLCSIKKVSVVYLNSPTRKCSSYIVANRCILIKEKKNMYLFLKK